MIKAFLRNLIINLGALWIVSQLLPGGVVIEDGLIGLLKISFIFMIANLILVPLIKILLLPLNLLTFGLFAWLANVFTLYILVRMFPHFKLLPFVYTGFEWHGFTIPPIELNIFQVAIVASFLLSLTIHFLHWLAHK